MWCHGCQASFVTQDPIEVTRQDEYACPNGHTVSTMREAALGNNGQED